MEPSKHDGLIVNYDAGGDITRRRIIAYGAADYEAVQASGNSDPFLGVSTDVDAVAGGPVDAIRDGIGRVEYGGNVTRGNWLTSDADGRAVEAAPASGVNVQVLGKAEVSGVAGDIGAAFIQPFELQGA